MKRSYGKLLHSRVRKTDSLLGELSLLYCLWEGEDSVLSLTVELTYCESGLREDVLLEDVSGDPARAAELLECLAEGLVTPMTAEEIFSDFFAV